MKGEVSTVEREGDHLFKPGKSGNPNGRPKGIPNKISKTIRQAVMESIEPGNCHPDGLAGWLIERARGGIEDRKLYAAVVSRVIPIEITGEGGGAVKVDLGWLAGRKIGGEVIDVTPTTQRLDTANNGAALREDAPDLISDQTISGGGVEAQPAPERVGKRD